jgi:predicted ATPase/DNA-binding SARP family transcriptional activator/Tfp pilus assembly protein PilF
MDQSWQIDLLGRLWGWREGQSILQFRTQKSGLLLAYLALHRRHPTPRDVLAELLWPGSTTAAGRRNLRVELAALRSQLERPPVPTGSIFIARRASVQLDPRAVDTDVARFEAALQEAAGGAEPVRRVELLSRACGHYGGELLPGYYDDWVLLERERLADRHRAALGELCRLLHQTGELEQAIDVAHRLVAVDPLNETAHFDLIRLYASTRRPHHARRQFRELEQRLQEELGLAPSAAVRQFMTTLASERSRAGPPCGPGGPEPETSLPAGEDRPGPREGLSQPRLPLPSTRFFGRTAEIAQLCRLLDTSQQGEHPPRLVTLTGPGGSGKTRLAIEVARQLSPSFRGAVWFVSLGELGDPAAIPAAVAEGMRLPRSVDLDPLEQAAAVLSRQPSLLVLDNLEHLLECGRVLVQRLLQQASTLNCLVTSRQRLALEGERELPVGPLPVPVDGCWLMVDGPAKAGLPDPSTINHQLLTVAQCPSVQLFVDRAQAARADFELTERNAGSVAAICARLEGVPLAIELAAAWASSLTPAQIAAHLEHGFSLLVSRRQDSVPRHQSLQAAIDWSYRLLEPALQRFLAQLTIFQGGWEIEAAQLVCDQPEALSLIAALRDRSLVAAEEYGDRMRYRMLESLRGYARAQLSDGEWGELAGRHIRYYRALAEEAEPHLERAEQQRWAERLQADTANLEAALGYADRACDLGAPGAEDGLRLAAALCRFWQLRGQAREGGAWLARLLAVNPGAPPLVRARAGFAAAALAYRDDEPARGEALCEEGLRLVDQLPGEDALGTTIRPLVSPILLLHWRGVLDRHVRLREALERNRDDPQTEAILWALDGMQTHHRCDYAAADTRYEQSLTRYRELGDRQGTAAIVSLQGSLALDRGDYAAARRHWEEALALYQELGDLNGALRAIGDLAYVAFWQADYPSAGEWMEEALTLSRQIGSASDAASTLWQLGCLACSQGEYDRAAALLEESLMIRRTLGVTWPVADSLSALGVLAHARGDWARARALQEEALELRRRREDRLDVAAALVRLGVVALAEGRLTEAVELYGEGLDLSREIGSDRGAAPALLGLGLAACRQGDLAQSEERLRESLALLRRMGDRKTLAEGVEALAELRARQRREEEAVALYAAADALREAIGAPVPLGDRPRQTRALTALRAALGPDQFAAVWAAARTSDPDALLAMGDGDRLAPQP